MFMPPYLWSQTSERLLVAKRYSLTFCGGERAGQMRVLLLPEAKVNNTLFVQNDINNQQGRRSKKIFRCSELMGKKRVVVAPSLHQDGQSEVTCLHCRPAPAQRLCVDRYRSWSNSRPGRNPVQAPQ